MAAVALLRQRDRGGCGGMAVFGRDQAERRDVASCFLGSGADPGFRADQQGR
jgi:hypothetical protein